MGLACHSSLLRVAVGKHTLCHRLAGRGQGAPTAPRGCSLNPTSGWGPAQRRRLSQKPEQNRSPAARPCSGAVSPAGNVRAPAGSSFSLGRCVCRGVSVRAGSVRACFPAGHRALSFNAQALFRDGSGLHSGAGVPGLEDLLNCTLGLQRRQTRGAHEGCLREFQPETPLFCLTGPDTFPTALECI